MTNVLLLAMACRMSPQPIASDESPPDSVSGADDQDSGGAPLEGREWEDERGSLNIEWSEDEATGRLWSLDGALVLRVARGGKRPLRLREVGDPVHEYDVGIFSEDGTPLMIASGGSMLVHPEWMEGGNSRRDIQADFQAIGVLADLMDPDALPEWGPLVQNMAAYAHAEALGEVDPPTVQSPPDRGVTYRQKTHIYAAALAPADWKEYLLVAAYTAATGRWPEHSSVKVNVYDSNGSLKGIYLTYNHGRGPADATMSQRCYTNFSGRSSSRPNLFDQACDASGGSWGLGSGYHVCNDDTYAEYSNVKFDASSTWATCSDNSLRDLAPSCY